MHRLKYVLVSGRKERSQPTAMDRQNMENGKNQRELFQWLLPRTVLQQPLEIEAKPMVISGGNTPVAPDNKELNAKDEQALMMDETRL